MKPVVVALVLICGGAPALAQETPVRLKDGATWTIRAEHTQAAESMGPTHNWGLITVKRVTWHAGRHGEPATITVTPVSAKALPGSPVEIEAARSLAIPATLAVDDALAPGAVINTDEVRAAFLKVAPSAKDDTTGLADAASKAMIASELALTSQAQGISFKAGKTISADAETPNPMGGPPMRVVESASLEAYDKQAGRAVIRWRRVLDPSAFKASIDSLLATFKEKAPPEKVDEARQALADAKMESQTLCRHEIDLATGLAVKTDCDMTLSTTLHGKSQKVAEHWAITQTLPEKP
jgi:hypothetical protein